MSATNALENALLSLLFENANAANIGDATGLRGSTTAGLFWVSLHTADPGEAGSQNTSEATYPGYAGAGARQSVARSTAGWTVASGVCDNDALIAFGQCTSGTQSITNFGIGSDQTLAGNLFFKGPSSLAVSTGITPQFAAGALDITLD